MMEPAGLRLVSVVRARTRAVGRIAHPVRFAVERFFSTVSAYSAALGIRTDISDQVEGPVFPAAVGHRCEGRPSPLWKL